jgi:hypothetical protein
MDLLLHRIGWSVQVPAWRAAERDEAAIAAWREERRALHLIVFFRQHQVAGQGMDAGQREQLVKPRPSDGRIENAGLPGATIATISTVLRRGAVGVGRTSVMGSGC